MRHPVEQRHPLSDASRAWLRSEDGGLSVEFVLWTPLLMAFLLLVVDSSMAFLAQGAMWHAAGEISRAVATGQMTIAEAEAAAASMAGYTASFQQMGEFLVVQLARPFEGIGTGMILSLVGAMEVQVVQLVEPGVEI